MHNRVYLKAPSINELRNTGSHTALQKTMDKKNSLGNLIILMLKYIINSDEVEGRKNLMITVDLNDNLKKNILVILFVLIANGFIFFFSHLPPNKKRLLQSVRDSECSKSGASMSLISQLKTRIF